MSLRNFLPIVIYGLMIGVLGILAAIPLGLGLLILLPMLAIASYSAYRDIFYGG